MRIKARVVVALDIAVLKHPFHRLVSSLRSGGFKFFLAFCAGLI